MTQLPGSVENLVSNCYKVIQVKEKSMHFIYEHFLIKVKAIFDLDLVSSLD